VPVAKTLIGCRAILAGETDGWPEDTLYMVGDLDEARARAAQTQRTPPGSAA